jgi:hypothetical protein
LLVGLKNSKGKQISLSDLQLKEWNRFFEADAIRFAKEIEEKIDHYITLLNVVKQHYCGQNKATARKPFSYKMFLNLLF